jgi:hypothetical protein
VRTSQLDKEAAELRDEAAHLHTMQAALDGASAQALRQQVGGGGSACILQGQG